MIYKEYKNDSYNLYTIKTDKFKTCHMEVIFYEDIKKDKITITNVLTDMLVHSSSKYPKRKNVVEKLEDLYNANFFSIAGRVGNLRTYNFVYNFIDPLYADKSYLKEVIKFPFEMLFNPHIKNDEFDLRTLKIIKNRNQADILSVKESPARYAIKRALNLMNENHPASYHLVGNLDDLDKITPVNLVTEYKRMLNNCKCDIYLVGNLNMEKVNLMINELFRNNIIKNINYSVNIKEQDVKKIQDITEHDNFAQASLVCLYDVLKLNPFEKNLVMNVFNSIFGSGSLNTKLYQNVREKNSLCYNISSMYQKHDNLLIIYTGIDAKNKNKAVKEIKLSLKSMQTGDFSDDDLKNTIATLKNNIKFAMDSPSSLTDNYFFHNLVASPFYDDALNDIVNVTKDDVINVAKKIKLNTIYMMAPGGQDERN